MTDDDLEFDVFVASIRMGDFDQRLDEVYEALSARRNYLNASGKLRMTVGTRVMAKPTVKPSKLQMRLGTVVDMMPRSKDRVLIEWDRGHERWQMSADSLLIHTGDAVIPTQ